MADSVNVSIGFLDFFKIKFNKCNCVLVFKKVLVKRDYKIKLFYRLPFFKITFFIDRVVSTIYYNINAKGFRTDKKLIVFKKS